MVTKQLFNYSRNTLWAVDGANNRLTVLPYSTVSNQFSQLGNPYFNFNQNNMQQQQPFQQPFQQQQPQPKKKRHYVKEEDVYRPPKRPMLSPSSTKEEILKAFEDDEEDTAKLVEYMRKIEEVNRLNAEEDEEERAANANNPNFNIGNASQKYFNGYQQAPFQQQYQQNQNMNMMAYEMLTVRTVGSVVGEESYKNINPPSYGSPSLVAEIGMVVYSTYEEREKAIETMGSGREILSSMLNDSSTLIAGAYSGIVNLSDADYYMVDNQEVIKIPKMPEEQKRLYIRQHGIDQERLTYNDLLVVSKSTKKRAIIDNINQMKNEVVFKNEFMSKDLDNVKGNEEDPIIMVNNGFWVFRSDRGARKFIARYSTFLDYIIDKARIDVRREHEEEIQALNAAHIRERSTIVRNAAILAGTTVLGVLVQKFIEFVASGGFKGKAPIPIAV